MKSRFLSRIADRLILRPSRDAIDPEGRRRELVSTPNGVVEFWVTGNQRAVDNQQERYAQLSAREPLALKLTEPVDVLALKFPGTAGRAERGGPHPFELLPSKFVEIWAINPPGYGGSEGTASLENLPLTLDAIWEQIETNYPGIPIAVIGNSLGCVSALYLAARRKVAGVYLRNPVPVKQLIQQRLRYNWWNLGMARWLADQLPPELDAIANARLAKAELLLVSSGRDRLCPWPFQQMIWDAYLGSKSKFVIQGAAHHDRVPEEQIQDYQSVASHFLTKTFAAA